MNMSRFLTLVYFLFSFNGFSQDTDGDGVNDDVDNCLSVANGPSTIGATVAGDLSGSGAGSGQFNRPKHIIIDDSGNLYISDKDNHRIQKWEPGATEGTTVAGGNGSGSNANQLNKPKGIILDASGNLYIVDFGNNRVQKWVLGATEGTTVAGGNGSGSNANQFNGPLGVVLDTSGNLYISDKDNHRIQKWEPGATEGTTVAGGNGSGSNANQLNKPKGIIFDNSGNLYIADFGNERIQKWVLGATEGTTVAGGNGNGSNANQFKGAGGVTLDVSGNMYIADLNNHRIQKWIPGASEGTTVAGGNGSGSNANQLNKPKGVVIDASGNLYITDTYNHRIQKWTLGQLDTDGDKIGDACDNCPSTSTGDVVDANGCSNSQKDTDGDGINDDVDNCKFIANSDQRDEDEDGVGDVCYVSDILYDKHISIREDISVDKKINLKSLIPENLNSLLTYEYGKYEQYLSINSSRELLIKKEINLFEENTIKIPIEYKIQNINVLDTLNIQILKGLDWQKNIATTQNNYIPYFFNYRRKVDEKSWLGNGYVENNGIGEGQFFPYSEKQFIIRDINNDGIKDIIGKSGQLYYLDESKEVQRQNINKIGIPEYLFIDQNFNIKHYHENYSYPDVFTHNSDFIAEIDLDGDNIKEILNVGEHYHSSIVDANNKEFVQELFKKRGIWTGFDYDKETGYKVHRIYTNNNERLNDFNEIIDDSELIENYPDPFVAIFGHAIGDIDNDGDEDAVISLKATGGLYIDILRNNGSSKLVVEREETVNYNTTPEGVNILMDINNDGYPEYIFGGSTNDNETINKIGYLNNLSGNFDYSNPVWLNELESTQGLAPKDMFKVDLNNDGNEELLIYRSTGLGNPFGTENKEFLNEILILNNELKDITSETIDKNNTSKMFSQSSSMYYVDIDGDKVKDIFIHFFTDSLYSSLNANQPYYGYWDNNSDLFSYFKGNEDGKFNFKLTEKFTYSDELKEYGKLDPSNYMTNIGNNFQPHDLDGDGTAELIHQGDFRDNIVIFKYIFDTDGDGVTDDIDQCPFTKSGETVNEKGCSDNELNINNSSGLIVANNQIGEEFLTDLYSFEIQEGDCPSTEDDIANGICFNCSERFKIWDDNYIIFDYNSDGKKDLFAFLFNAGQSGVQGNHESPQGKLVFYDNYLSDTSEPQYFDSEILWGGWFDINDFNNDGFYDILVTGNNSHEVSAITGLQYEDIPFEIFFFNSGGFSERREINMLPFSSNGPMSGDIDNDGDIDIIVQKLGGGNTDEWRNSRSFTLLNDGNGNFVKDYDFFTEISGEQERMRKDDHGQILYDINEDGCLDWVLPVWNNGQFIIENNELIEKEIDGGGPTSYDDLIFVDGEYIKSGSRILWGDCSGEFNLSNSTYFDQHQDYLLSELSEYNFENLFGANNYNIFDFNQDGINDIILAKNYHNYGTGLQLFMGKNDGTYTDVTQGSLDVFFFKNTGDNGTQVEGDFPRIWNIAVKDKDGDGDMDLIPWGMADFQNECWEDNLTGQEYWEFREDNKFYFMSDTDMDGIYDSNDNCPDTPTGEAVDAVGCSDSQKDTDADGVTDDVDTCPDTPTGEAVDAVGCSDSQKDTDADGVTDDVDTCLDTPTGEAVDAVGCSDSQKDTDADGVTDDIDTCPDTPTGEAVDANGCSDSQKDTDADGVTDNLDTCPDTPTGEAVDATGCSDSQKDTDADGVTDDIDTVSFYTNGRNGRC